MNKFIDYKLTIIDRVYDLGLDFAELIAQNPFTQELFNKNAEYKQNALYYTAEVDQSVKSKWHEKATANEELIKITVRARRALKGFGDYKDFAPFADLTDFSPSDLEYMSDQELHAHVVMLQNVIIAHDAEAKEAGFSNERYDELNAALQKSKSCSGQPIDLRSKIKLTNEDLTEMLKEFTKLLNALTNHMNGVYAGVQYQFYDAFLVAINVPRPYKHKLCMRGSFTNTEGNAVRNVWITIDGEKEVVKRAKKGGYKFNYLEPGVHEFVFRCKGYITQTHTVTILPGETLELNIQFEPVTAEVAEVVD